MLHILTCNAWSVIDQTFVPCRDKMRRFVEISHIEFLVSVVRYGNVVYCGEKSFHLS